MPESDGNIYIPEALAGGPTGPKRLKPREEWTVCEDAHEAIVSQELADAVNLARSLKPLELNLNHQARNAQRRLLSGLVSCGVCGGPYTIGTSVKRDQKRLYYRCPKTGTCHNRWIRCEDLEATVERAVLGRLTAKGFFRETAAAIERNRRTAERDANRQQEAVGRKLESLRKKRARLVDAVAEGIIDREDARERLDAIRREMDDLGQKLNQIPPEKPLENPQNVLSAIRDLVTRDLGPEALRSLYSVVVGQVVVTRDSTVLSWRLPLENEPI